MGKLQKKAMQFDKVSYNRFQNALANAGRKIDDLSVPLSIMGDRFIESRKFIFDENRSGPGVYKDLSARYKRQKMALTKKRGRGFIYPILLLTGRLKKSLTQMGGENIKIVGKKSLEIGTEVPYGIKHQEGRGVPKRQFLFWGPEYPRFARNSTVRKINKSMAVTLFNYVERKLGRTLKASIKRAEKDVGQLFERGGF